MNGWRRWMIWTSAGWLRGVQLAQVLGQDLFDGVELIGERDGDEGRHVLLRILRGPVATSTPKNLEQRRTDPCIHYAKSECYA
jgi:hypothetical protein